MGGKLNSARFVTENGTDEWVWLEVLGFDARPVSGEAAALRSEVARYFEARAPSPYFVLASASVRLDGSFTAATRSGGLLLELPVDTSWAGPTRISVCREFFRPWLGAELRLVGDSHEASPGELWFNEDVARALARETRVPLRNADIRRVRGRNQRHYRQRPTLTIRCDARR